MKKGEWACPWELWYFTAISHPVSPAPVMYSCTNSSMLQLSCTCWCNKSIWCFPSFVSPYSCTELLASSVLLAQHNCMCYSSIAWSCRMGCSLAEWGAALQNGVWSCETSATVGAPMIPYCYILRQIWRKNVWKCYRGNVCVGGNHFLDKIFQVFPSHKTKLWELLISGKAYFKLASGSA